MFKKERESHPPLLVNEAAAVNPSMKDPEGVCMRLLSTDPLSSAITAAAASAVSTAE